MSVLLIQNWRERFQIDTRLRVLICPNWRTDASTKDLLTFLPEPGPGGAGVGFEVDDDLVGHGEEGGRGGAATTSAPQNGGGPLI